MLTQGSPTRPLTLGEFDTSLASLARFEDPPFLAVAVSGGPDSLALAILAHRWAHERDGQICALTVDHRMRPESGAEIRQLGTWLTARGIPHDVLVWSGEKPRTGIQEAARVARYRLLSGWCREHGCLHLLTAHHREDQIETHLIRCRAHSGADGLAGMSAIREFAGCRLLRPLLGVPKERLVALLDAEDQPFITDSSNRDPGFERARLRGDSGAMRDLADLPGRQALIRKFGYERAARDGYTNIALARAVSLHPAGFAVLDPALLRAVPGAMAERVLSMVVATIGAGFYPARRESVARLRSALASAACHGHTLGGCRFATWRERILVLRERARAAKPVRLTPGASLLWDRRFNISLPLEQSEPVTVGYLDPAGVIELNRSAPQLRKNQLPRLLFPNLPAVWDEEGLAAVPHLGYRRRGAGALPRFVFRPVSPLTQASFAVV